MTQQEFWQLMMFYRRLQQKLGKRLISIEAARTDSQLPALVTYMNGIGRVTKLMTLEGEDVVEVVEPAEVVE